MRQLTRTAVPLLLLWVVGCRGGCGRGTDRALGTTLSNFPAETRVVLSLNVSKVRSSALWQRITGVLEDNPEDRRKIAELASRTGFDPLRDLRRVVVAFPDDARKAGAFALLIEGSNLDERRLVAWAREQAKKDGRTIETRQRGARTLHVAGGAQPVAAFFPGRDRVLVGGGGWAETMADLADGAEGVRSAETNGDLLRLAKRIGTSGALWFAAVVPGDVRNSLMAQPQPGSAASVTRVGGSMDVSPALGARFVADLSNEADAQALAQQVQTTVRQAKGNAKTLMLGLGPYLDAVEAKSKGPSVHVTLTLTPGQTQDLVARLAGLLQLARGR